MKPHGDPAATFPLSGAPSTQDPCPLKLPGRSVGTHPDPRILGGSLTACAGEINENNGNSMLFFLQEHTKYVGFPGGSVVRNPPANAGNRFDEEDPLEKEMAIQSMWSEKSQT